MQIYHNIKMNPNGKFINNKVFAYPKLQFIFAIRKGGAIAHPGNYREAEQRSDSYRNENPIPGELKSQKLYAE